MDNAHNLAMIFGPFLAIIGLWMVCHAEQLSKIVASFHHQPAALYLYSVFSLLVGLTILSLHATWEWNLSVLVTLLGWLYVIRAVVAFYLPTLSSRSFTIPPIWYRIGGWIPLAWGLALSWLALGT